MLIENVTNPKDTIFYCSSIILEYLRLSSHLVSIEELYIFCKMKNISYSQMLFSIDWLYLIGSINGIGEKGEIVT